MSDASRLTRAPSVHRVSDAAFRCRSMRATQDAHGRDRPLEARTWRYWLVHYAILIAFIVFALFPLYWLLKVSVTPTKLLYTEGIRMWPSETTWENYGFVLTRSEFPRFFMNSVIVSGVDRHHRHHRRGGGRLRLLALRLPRQDRHHRADADHPDVPAGDADRADLQDPVAARPDQQPDRARSSSIPPSTCPSPPS